MTLPSSGTITAAMINAELGRSATAYFNINGSAERTLAGRPSGAIYFNHFHGKSNLPPAQTISNRGMEYSGWSNTVGTTSPYTNAIWSATSAGTFYANRNVGWTNISVRANFSASLQFYKSGVSNDTTFQVYTDGALQYSIVKGMGENNWTTTSVSASNILINNTTIFRLQNVNGSGGGSQGCRSCSFSITPLSRP